MNSCLTSQQILRLAAVAFVTLVAVVAVVQSRHGQDPANPTPVERGEADVLVSELARCRTITSDNIVLLDSCRGIWAENRQRFFVSTKSPQLPAPPELNEPAGPMKSQERVPAAPSRPGEGPVMGGTGVIDRFLEVFTRYIDSGFGLLNGEVAFLATTLAAIDITLAAIFWSWAAEEDIIARLAKKTLFVGVFAYLIGNWNNLARIVFESFAGLGLKASGTGMSTADLLSPGRVAQVGIDAGRPILELDLRLNGLRQFLRKLRSDRSPAIRLDRGAARILHFGDPALCDADRVQADDAGGFCADPLRSLRQDGVCRRARARQRHLIGCQGPGSRRDRRHRFDLVLAIHRRIRRQPAHHRRCHVHGLGGTVPAGARHLRPWNRQRHCVRRSAARRRCSRRDRFLRRAELSPRASQAPAWPRAQQADCLPERLAAALQSPPLLPTLSAQDVMRQARRHRTLLEPGRAELPLARHRLLIRRRGRRE